jgi:uncharacterized protein
MGESKIVTGKEIPPKKRLRDHVKCIFLLDGNPSFIALSFALGVFVSFSPIYGFHSLTAVFIAYILRLNLFTALVGAWINTPLTAPFVYGGCYVVGRAIIGGPDLPMGDSLLNWGMIQNVLIQLIIGWCILGLLAGVISFFCLRYGIQYYRSRKQCTQ